MQLLAYAVHRAQRTPVIGLAIGDDPRPETFDTEAPITAYAELRMGAQHPDPVTTLQLLAAKAFGGRVKLVPDVPVEVVGHDAQLVLMVGPEFDHPRAVVAALQPLLQMCRVRGTTLTTAQI